jgi:tRNA A37 methylthiotransferase MiaB
MARILRTERLSKNLLEALIPVKGLAWIRMLYAHPQGISDRLLDLMEAHEEICPYLDIPLQHIAFRGPEKDGSILEPGKPMAVW